MSKRRELEARRQEQQRRQTIQIAVIIGVIAVVVIGGAILLSAASGGSTPANPSLPPAKTSTKPIPPNAEANGRAWGPKDAPITIVEYLDYQCPACGNFAKSFEQGIVEAFANTGKVRYEIRYMPFLEDKVPGSRESRDPAQATLCAADQSKFWEMHNTLFVNQLITGEENTGNFSKQRLKEMAATIPGMDAAAFAACLDSNKHEQTVLQERAAGEQLGVMQTPSFLINGKLFAGDARTATPDGLKQIFAEVASGVKFDQ